MYRVESCLSRNWKLSKLELLAPANSQSCTVLSEVKLLNNCSQVEKLKSTLSLHQKDFEKKLDNNCDNADEANKEVLGKWSVECEALRNNLRAAAAAAAEIAKPEHSIDLLMQDLASLKPMPLKKAKLSENEKMSDHFRSALYQLQPVFAKHIPEKRYCH